MPLSNTTYIAIWQALVPMPMGLGSVQRLLSGCAEFMEPGVKSIAPTALRMKGRYMVFSGRQPSFCSIPLTPSYDNRLG